MLLLLLGLLSLDLSECNLDSSSSVKALASGLHPEYLPSLTKLYLDLDLEVASEVEATRQALGKHAPFGPKYLAALSQENAKLHLACAVASLPLEELSLRVPRSPVLARPVGTPMRRGRGRGYPGSDDVAPWARPSSGMRFDASDEWSAPLRQKFAVVALTDPGHFYWTS